MSEGAKPSGKLFSPEDDTGFVSSVDKAFMSTMKSHSRLYLESGRRGVALRRTLGTGKNSSLFLKPGIALHFVPVTLQRKRVDSCSQYFRVNLYFTMKDDIEDPEDVCTV
jgi:hypothetical protein